MFCPVCSHTDTRVIDSRLSPDGTSIRRRRECDQCQYRFSTLEEIELLDITVVKRDGRREGYGREKIERGLRKALEKRSYTENAFREMVNSIERNIQRLKSNEVTSQQIGELLMNALKQFDKVAYIRFASVYRAFEDVETFQDELKNLMHSKQQMKRNKKS